jgi:hypothetical protein
MSVKLITKSNKDKGKVKVFLEQCLKQNYEAVVVMGVDRATGDIYTGHAGHLDTAKIVGLLEIGKLEFYSSD